MQRSLRSIGFWAAFLIGIYIIYSIVISGMTNTDKMVYSDLVRAIKQEEVTNMVVNGNTVTATIKDEKGKDTVQKIEIPSLDILQNDVGTMINDQMDAGILTQEAYRSKISWVAISNIVLTLVFIFLLIFMFMQKGGARNGGGFTKSKAVMTGTHKVKFSDVAGAVE